ncbi:MAG: 50S ribosomal protein L3 [bacterium]
MGEEVKKESEATETEETGAQESAGAVPQAKEAPAGFKVVLCEKLGMTQMFDSSGRQRAVSVLKTGSCTVVAVRTHEKNGYAAVCLGFGEKSRKNMSRALQGQFDKIKVPPLRHLQEFRIPSVQGFEPGQKVTLKDRFVPGDYVDVQGITKGKGFAGGMKRHNFSGMPASHGASDRERAPGSLASRRSLGRVLPGQRMAGHMGNVRITVAKMEVTGVVPEENLLLINGPVPGSNGVVVAVMETSKPRKKVLVQAAAKSGKAKKSPVKSAAKPAQK